MALADINVRIGTEIAGLKKGLKASERALKRTSRKFQDLGASMSAAITLPIAGIMATSIKAAGKMQALEQGLAAIMGNSKLAKKEIELLRKEAENPGLNFEQALKGSVRLQAVQVSAELARKTLAAFGNAITLVGGSAQDLDGVTLALTQIASKGKVSAEEINQIAERVPQIRTALKDAFGTADTEQLQKMGVDFETFLTRIVAQLQRLPKASGGINNSIANMQMKLQEAAASIGKVLIPYVDVLIEKINNLTTWFNGLNKETKDNIVKWGLIAAAIGPVVLIVGKAIAIFSTFKGLLIGAKIAFLQLNVVMRANPILAVVSAITALVGALVVAYNTSAKFRGVLFGIMEMFVELGRIVANFAKNVGTGFASILKGDFKAGFAELGKAASKLNPLNFWKAGQKLGLAYQKGFTEKIEADKIAAEVGKTIKEVTDKINQDIDTNEEKQIKIKIKRPTFETASIASGLGAASSIVRTDSIGQKIEGQEQDKQFQQFIKKFDIINKKRAEATTALQEFNTAVSNTIGAGISDTLSNIGVAIGQVMAGTAKGASIAGAALGGIADIMMRLGKMAIGAGAAIKGINVSLKSLNPVAAIAGGIALVALATVLKSKAAKLSAGPPKLAKGGVLHGRTLVEAGEYSGARSNPEVIAPLNTLPALLSKAMGGNMQGGSLTARISGDDLLILMERATNRQKRYGIG